MKMPTSKAYNNESPLFHSSKAEHAGVTLFLDFNKKDILQGLYYTLQEDSPWKESLSKLAVGLEGKAFSELHASAGSNLSEGEHFFDLPLFLLKEALDSYRGKAPALHELKNEDANDLICRCFGIYKNELLSVLDENPDFKDKDLTNATKAGAGCTTCLSDFQELIAEGKARQAKKLLES